MLWVTHLLPLWFLVFSLFLPRVALFLLWFDTAWILFPIRGILALIIGILLPRALVMYLIYCDQGFSVWLILHFVAALVVWGGSGRYSARRRRDRYHEIG